MLALDLKALDKWVPNKTVRANLSMIAQSCASKAYLKGERWGGGLNKTTYPKKHYPELERVMGRLLDAKELTFFDRAYDSYMRWEGDSRAKK